MEDAAIVKGRRIGSNFLIKVGTLVNLKERKYKLYERFMGFVMGAWEPLPKLDYVLIFKTLLVKCEDCTLEDFDNKSTYQLSLVYNKNRRLIVHESRRKDEIFNMAGNLAANLNLKIRDAASDRRQPKWI